LGDSRQKLFFLPEAHTDYILSIVGEEVGLIGLAAVAITFMVLVWRGARASVRARDPFGCYLGFGITAMFGLQALVNFAVVLNAIPTMGLPLPFVSFGGSTLVVDLFAMGILLNISRGAPEPVKSNVERAPGQRRSGARKLPGGGRRITVEV
jgi:cell division protein FtsW